MEYGYEIVDTAGNKTFFVEGCTCCQMSTGGVHESNCPYKKDEAGYVAVEPLIERNCNHCRLSNEDDLCDKGHIERQPGEADYALACLDFEPLIEE